MKIRKLWRTKLKRFILQFGTGSFWPDSPDLIPDLRCRVLQLYTKMAFFHFTPVGPERIVSVTTRGGGAHAHRRYLSTELLNREVQVRDKLPRRRWANLQREASINKTETETSRTFNLWAEQQIQKAGVAAERSEVIHRRRPIRERRWSAPVQEAPTLDSSGVTVVDEGWVFDDAEMQEHVLPQDGVVK